MSETQTQATPKKRRARSPSVAKPAFIIVQVTNDQGEPIQFSKKNLKVVAVERSAEKVMEAMDNATYDNAFYLRIVVPVNPSVPRAKKTELQAVA